ncbi:MAG: phenylacetate--CoA ligase family protein [Candidatus Abyssobacteria bacterium SURF_5]|uniref:Phenylacetate--CoA ligase family protein n=1 Tax=Abyssobacteria bacterium (strain SURF_5) TaxID=2093360 RepID=A0A3A4NQD2_ABYX5|nr:MAG: phenylacetate--CoA ligase family protein [Candidatus Abyssubacteria bacterium SURF_5]
MHPTIARHAIYLPVRKALGGNLETAIERQTALERLPHDRLRAYQEKALKRLIDHAIKNIPFYRDLGMRRLDVKGGSPLEIIQHFPITSKVRLRSDLRSFIADGHKVSWRSTSGSTGFPFRFCKDRLALLHMDAAMHAAYSWHDIQIGDRQARIWGRRLNRKQKFLQDIKDLLLNRRRLSAFEITSESSRFFFAVLDKLRPAFLYCYPNAAVLFARHLRQMRLNARSLSLKAIICTSEPLLELHRNILTDVFACSIINEYGNSENGILGIECERGNMHVLSGNVILEVRHKDKPAPPGIEGQIVVTELHSRSIPFIRYQTEDFGSLTTEPCPCGRTFPVIKLSPTRGSSVIACPDGRKVHDALLAYIFHEGVLQFRVVQEALTSLSVEVVPDHNYSKGLEENYRNKLLEYCGAGMNITFKKREAIQPEQSGKVSYFVSRLRETRN